LRLIGLRRFLEYGDLLGFPALGWWLVLIDGIERC
jgi:hypothetical protein